MSLPIGHAAIGFATHTLFCEKPPSSGRWKALLGMVILSNLPDVDVILGIALQGNGNVFHRGPAHSLMFALVAGFLACRACGLWSPLSQLTFRGCFLLILSHILADSVFTSSPISLFWPISVNWSGGYSELRQVVHLVLFGNHQDAEIIIGCVLLILLYRKVSGLGMFKGGPDLKSVLRLGADAIE